jgi:hypothetical protein
MLVEVAVLADAARAPAADWPGGDLPECLVTAGPFPGRSAESRRSFHCRRV